MWDKLIQTCFFVYFFPWLEIYKKYKNVSKLQTRILFKSIQGCIPNKGKI